MVSEKDRDRENIGAHHESDPGLFLPENRQEPADDAVGTTTVHQAKSNNGGEADGDRNTTGSASKSSQRKLPEHRRRM